MFVNLDQTLMLQLFQLLDVSGFDEVNIRVSAEGLDLTRILLLLLIVIVEASHVVESSTYLKNNCIIC